MNRPVERPADLTPVERAYLRSVRESFETPPTLGRLIVRSWRQYGILFGAIAGLLWLCWTLEQRTVMWWTFGLLSGVVLRDLGFLGRGVNLWPVSAAIIDRRRVGELLGDEHDRPARDNRP